MAAPCINDTCTVTSTIDPVTRRLELDVNIAGTGGLECVDGVGIGVRVLDDVIVNSPGTITDTCYNQIGMFNGDLFSIPKRAKIHSFSSSDSVTIPQNANEGNFSFNAIDTGNLVNNPYACASLAVITGRFLVRYTVGLPSDGSVPPVDECLADGNGEFWVPFNSDIHCRFFIDGGTNALVAQYPDCSGIMKRNAVNPDEIKDAWHYFSYQVLVAGNAALSLVADARHVGGTGQNNANTATTGYDRGFKCDGQITFMPFNGDVI